MLHKRQLQTIDGWTDDDTISLETVKAKLAEPPVLALPPLQGNYTVETDACYKQIGFVFLENKPAVPTEQMDIVTFA